MENGDDPNFQNGKLVHNACQKRRMIANRAAGQWLGARRGRSDCSHSLPAFGRINASHPTSFCSPLPRHATSQQQPNTQTSAEERQLECEHFGRCSGCTQLSVDRPPVFQEAQRFFASHGYQGLRLAAGPVHGWRCRARLAVRGWPGALKLGLYKAGSHTVLDIPRCSIHHPRINQAAAAVRAATEALRVAPFDEETGKGQLRYLQLWAAGREEAGFQAQTDAAAPVQVVLVWSGAADDAQLAALAAALWQAGGTQHPPLLHSVWANFHAGRGNAVLGPRFELLHGDRWLWQQLGGARMCFAPGCFAQANVAAMDAALAAIQRAVPEGAGVVDLHSGVGVIGLAVAVRRRCSWLRCVEISDLGRGAFERAAAAARRTGMASPVEYIVAAAGDRPEEFLAGADVCIVDPPRKGLEAPLLRALCAGQAHLQTLVYLSCGWAAFQRDCTALLASGRWALESARCFLFFPGTDSIETLAVFTRVTSL